MALIVGAFAVIGAGAAGAQCLQQGDLDLNAIVKTTGVPALDAKFNTEANLLYDVFGTNPNLLILGTGSANAFSSSKVTLSGYRGTVYFSLALIRDELWAADRGEIAVAGIMAHEFGHSLQREWGCALQGHYVELHADFLAGYYLGRRQYVAPADIRGFLRSLYDKGDRDFWHPDHHGTPEQRVLASLAGYERATLPLTEAYRVGEQLAVSL